MSQDQLVFVDREGVTSINGFLRTPSTGKPLISLMPWPRNFPRDVQRAQHCKRLISLMVRCR
jgi:hypothetical protein